jgi:hypothetical protein
VIYGVALLSFCYLMGMFAGDLLGQLMGVQANVGGVGSPITEKGIGFWSAMYIPIVVAMAARQDVYSALSGGYMAIVAGIAAVAASFALIPVLARFGQGGQDDS